MKGLNKFFTDKKNIFILILITIILLLIYLIFDLISNPVGKDLESMDVDTTEIINSKERSVTNFTKSILDCRCYFTLAKIYNSQRNYILSNKELDKIDELSNINKDSVLFYKLDNYWNLENYEKVLNIGKECDELTNYNKYLIDRSKFMLAINSSDTNLLNTSINEYKANYDSNRNNYDYLLTYSFLLYKSGIVINKVLPLLDSVILKNQNMDIFPFLLKGMILLDQKDYKESLRYFNELLKSFPYHYNTHLYIGKSYYELKEYNNSLKSFQVSLAINETDVAYYNTAVTYIALGNDSLAFDMLKKSYKLNSQNVLTLFEMAKIYYQKDLVDKSILIMENVMEITVANYGRVGILHKKYMKYLINLYLHKNTPKFIKKAELMVYELCVIDPKDQESLEMYEKINREIFRFKLEE